MVKIFFNQTNPFSSLWIPLRAYLQDWKPPFPFYYSDEAKYSTFVCIIFFMNHVYMYTTIHNYSCVNINYVYLVFDDF